LKNVVNLSEQLYFKFISDPGLPGSGKIFRIQIKVPNPVRSGSTTMVIKLKFLEKRNLSCNLVDMDTELDRQALDADTDSAK
jgi:hypothetical protein